MNVNLWKAMPALIALTLTALGTPATAGPADGVYAVIGQVYAQVGHDTPPTCPAPKTINANNKAFYWTADNVRDPPGGEYLLSSWSKTSYYSGSGCGEVAFDCRVTVYGLTARPMDIVNVTKTLSGKTYVEGTYRGLSFHGTTGACSATAASFAGDIDVPVPILGFRHVTGQGF